jgi:hypothetical protein
MLPNRLRELEGELKEGGIRGLRVGGDNLPQGWVRVGAQKREHLRRCSEVGGKLPDGLESLHVGKPRPVHGRRARGLGQNLVPECVRCFHS